MALGFAFEVPAMAIAAGVQGWIYDTGPCCSHPRKCAAFDNGARPNHVNVAAQIPIYVLEAFSEAFAFAAMYEYAYPKRRKHEGCCAGSPVACLCLCGRACYRTQSDLP